MLVAEVDRGAGARAQRDGYIVQGGAGKPGGVGLDHGIRTGREAAEGIGTGGIGYHGPDHHTEIVLEVHGYTGKRWFAGILHAIAIEVVVDHAADTGKHGVRELVITKVSSACSTSGDSNRDVVRCGGYIPGWIDLDHTVITRGQVQEVIYATGCCGGGCNQGGTRTVKEVDDHAHQPGFACGLGTIEVGIVEHNAGYAGRWCGAIRIGGTAFSGGIGSGAGTSCGGGRRRRVGRVTAATHLRAIDERPTGVGVHADSEVEDRSAIVARNSCGARTGNDIGRGGTGPVCAVRAANCHDAIGNAQPDRQNIDHGDGACGGNVTKVGDGEGIGGGVARQDGGRSVCFGQTKIDGIG